jgi:hypothetical protein
MPSTNANMRCVFKTPERLIQPRQSSSTIIEYVL